MKVTCPRCGEEAHWDVEFRVNYSAFVGGQLRPLHKRFRKLHEAYAFIASIDDPDATIDRRPVGRWEEHHTVPGGTP